MPSTPQADVSEFLAGQLSGLSGRTTQETSNTATRGGALKVSAYTYANGSAGMTT